VSLKKIWSQLEHKIWRELKKIPVRDIESLRFVLAISGGTDSMALLHLLAGFREFANIHLYSMYVHHGESERSEISDYRNRASLFCKEQSALLGINFDDSEKPKIDLKSEADCREFRYKQLTKFQRQVGAKILVTAHHRDDLLETRMLRLVRGTSEEGLRAMQTWQANSFNREVASFIWRPLLNIGRSEIEFYIKEKNILYLEDPSNNESDFLRNWMRNKWLPLLENKRAGSVESLARSLDNMVQNQDSIFKESTLDLLIQSKIFLKNGKEVHQCFIEKKKFLTLDENEKKTLIIKLLKSAKINSFSLGQIKEILKQLDKVQKIHTFSLNNSIWVVDAEQVLVEPK
jgi:tRNA(Ile)-lysidine synthase